MSDTFTFFIILFIKITIYRLIFYKLLLTCNYNINKSDSVTFIEVRMKLMLQVLHTIRSHTCYVAYICTPKHHRLLFSSFCRNCLIRAKIHLYYKYKELKQWPAYGTNECSTVTSNKSLQLRALVIDYQLVAST